MTRYIGFTGMMETSYKNIIIYKALGQSDSTVLEDEIEDEDTTYGDHLYGADKFSDDDD